MELFGRKIRTKKGLSINTLDIFSYQTREENFLISQDAFYEYDILNDNKRFIASKIKTRNIVRNDENRMFFLSDSFNYLNFYAMHLIGPILVRNPYFTLFILKRLYEYIGLDFSFFHNTIEIDAYKKFIDKYVIDVLEERK